MTSERFRFFAASFGSLFVVGDGFHRFCAADYQLCQDWCLVAGGWASRMQAMFCRNLVHKFKMNETSQTQYRWWFTNLPKISLRFVLKAVVKHWQNYQSNRCRIPSISMAAGHQLGSTKEISGKKQPQKFNIDTKTDGCLKCISFQFIWLMWVSISNFSGGVVVTCVFF